MDNEELFFHLATLKECDPNYVVDVLGITSEQLIDSFHEEAIAFIEEDQGEG